MARQLSVPERNTMTSSTDVAIVGAGHNGLVAAAYLARAGLRVEVFERRPFVGGAAITEELWPGFRFSTCAHMIHSFHPKIFRDLRLFDRGLQICAREDGIALRDDRHYFGPGDCDSARNLAFEGRLTSDERKGLQGYNEFKNTLQVLFAPYRLRTPPTLAELRRDAAGTPAAHVLEHALATRLWDLHDSFLPTDTLRDRMACEGAAVGRNPSSLYLAYFSASQPEEDDSGKPPYGYVRGGLGSLTQALAEAAVEAGAVIHVDRKVQRFLVQRGRVIGLHLDDGVEVRSRVVVSNLDPKRTFLKMIPVDTLSHDFRQRVQGLITNVACYKLLAVISELPQWRAWDGDARRPHRGSVILGGTTRAEIAAAHDDCEAGQPPRAPVVSLSVPSVSDPTVTQPGYHTASAWIFPAPARLARSTWDEVRDGVADRLVDQITEYAPNFRKSICHLKLRTPMDMERENGLTDGCIWHVQHGGEQLFWNRPLSELASYRGPLGNLYLCGAAQHPGGEVTGMPGHNAAHEILKDLQDLGGMK